MQRQSLHILCLACLCTNTQDNGAIDRLRVCSLEPDYPVHIQVPDTAMQSAGQETAQACAAPEDDRTIQKLVVSLWAPDAMPVSSVAAGPVGKLLAK